MQYKLSIQIIFLYILFSCCNFNPLGGKNSRIDDGNYPFLNIPSSFATTNILASTNQVTLSWFPANNADSYTVLYGLSTGSYPYSSSACLNIKVTYCTITGLSVGTIYYFSVIASNIVGSRKADEVKVKTLIVFAFFTNQLNNTLTNCQIDPSNGNLSNCSVSGSILATPIGNVINHGTLYIAKFSGNTITQFNINQSTGQLSNNTTSYSPINSPNSLVIYGLWAYIVDYFDGQVYKCNINSDGTFNSCTQIVASGFTSPRGIVISNNFAYITSDSTVTKCNINTDGTLSVCVPTGSGFGIPLSITIFNNFAYIMDTSGNYVCSVNSFTGILTNCGPTALNVSLGRSIAFYNNIAFIGTGTAIAPLWRCTLNLDGSLSGCSSVTNIPATNMIGGVSIQAF